MEEFFRRRFRRIFGAYPLGFERVSERVYSVLTSCQESSQDSLRALDEWPPIGFLSTRRTSWRRCDQVLDIFSTG